MKRYFTITFSAIKEVLLKRKYKMWLVVLTTIFMIAYLLPPVLIIPGNDLFFQLSLLNTTDYVLFFAISLFTSLLILMQAYLFARSKKEGLGILKRGGSGVISSLFGGLLVTFSCPACAIGLLGFAGSGSLLFFVEKRLHLILFATILVVISIYYSARRVEGYCDTCKVSH